MAQVPRQASLLVKLQGFPIHDRLSDDRLLRAILSLPL
jgi:hypothetical protein